MQDIKRLILKGERHFTLIIYNGMIIQVVERNTHNKLINSFACDHARMCTFENVMWQCYNGTHWIVSTSVNFY